MPFRLVLHAVMPMRNAACFHTVEQTEAFSAYLVKKVASFKRVHDAGKWLSGCLHVRETVLNVRARIAVCSALSY